MNKFAYLTTILAVKELAQLSKLNIRIHGEKNIPHGSIIFVANHFTRIETLFLPRQIYQRVGIPIWSLADYGLFKGPLVDIFDKLGVISTRDPHRDHLIVKTLLTGEAAWVVYPEGRMVKSKKIIDKGRYMISYGGDKRPPHTGAATLALRTEFYRQRLKALEIAAPAEAKRLMASFQLATFDGVIKRRTYIVPINITYYPLRVHENRVSRLFEKALGNLSERGIEEIMAESTMLLSGVDVDIRFGRAIEMGRLLQKPFILKDIASTRRIDFDDPIPARKPMRKIALHVMFEYMSAIYRMTTVNHDHLFASMLRAIPQRKINEKHFRQKIFLAATQNLDKAKVYRHEDLEKDQVHLLTDDRYGQYRSFLSLALEKNVIRETKGDLIKDPSKFKHVFDFHRIRFENPIKVMANEVEPLSKLQRNIRLIAWCPPFLVGHHIVKVLMNRAVRRFKQAYRAFYRKGESKGMEVGMPYLIGNHRFRRTGILLVHGYMAAPPEVRELAEYLGRRGFLVYAPRVSGHGTSPDDLVTRTRLDWMKSVDEGYAIAGSLCKEVVVGGFSTGAGLALDLATRVKGITAVFAVAPPLRLQDFSVRFLPAIGAWNRSMELIKMESAKMVFIKNSPENPHINYFRNPVNGVRELGFLMASLERKLHQISIPALVIQADGDPIVNPKGSRRIFEQISSRDKEYLLFNFSRHGILLGKGAEKVHRAIGDFVQRVTAA
ncbi:MAG: alpha/beta fold hydrolase [Deltaproteobacteria bacterium]|nr:alpha/beta fold hydrolase [Deltaproteobacteria bacterium]